MNHLQQLMLHEPYLDKMKLVDIGAGKGGFMMQALDAGVDIYGLEKNEDNIKLAQQKMAEKGYEQNRIVQGLVESLPWPDAGFDFANASEVLEHVEDPDKMLNEIHRVLKTGGQAYVSIPNRFGLFDPHFHLYFINWMPRKWAMKILSMLKKHKDYSTDSGYQSLTQMHYHTYKNAIKLLTNHGFEVTDSRLKKVLKSINNTLVKKMMTIVYKLIAPWTLSTFHFWLVKK